MNEDQCKNLSGKLIELWRSWFAEELVAEFHKWLCQCPSLDYDKCRKVVSQLIKKSPMPWEPKHTEVSGRP